MFFYAKQTELNSHGFNFKQSQMKVFIPLSVQ